MWSRRTGGIAQSLQILGVVVLRVPIVLGVFGPYLFLYLATIVFYWRPSARVGRPIWIAATVIFVVATIFNATTH